jgi:two-component system chemotaxis sensor kinase CheA
MTFDQDFLRELLSTFVAEAQEHLNAATHRLLEFEKGGMDDAQAAQNWADVFREVHSLKGAARAMNLARVESVSHRLETLLGRVRNGQVAPTRTFFDLAYQTLDALGDLVTEAAGSAEASVDVDALVVRLETASVTPDRVADAAVAPIPPPTPPPVPATPAVAAASELAASAPTPTTPVSIPSPTAAPGDPAPRADSGPERPPAPIDETIRVTTAKLESLMAQVGELQAARLGSEQRAAELYALLGDVEAWEAERRSGRTPQGLLQGQTTGAAGNAAEQYLHQVSARLRALHRSGEADQRRFAQVMAGLQDDVRRMRMLPMSTVLQAFPRMVRDLAASLGKDVRLVIQGGETEVDRAVLEQVKDPLTHLLRNAVDHGIESPKARLAARKPGQGVITLTVAQRGDSILIEVSDDGAGINVAQVRANALRRGLATAGEVQSMSDHEALWLIFRSGVSTSAIVSDVSGRGVGMDVVRDRVERLHGLIDVQSVLGQGSRFALTLPLTVATTLCLLLQVAEQAYAIPVTNVTRIVRLAPDTLGFAEGQAVIREGDRPILLLGLADVLGLHERSRPAPKGAPPGRRGNGEGRGAPAAGGSQPARLLRSEDLRPNSGVAIIIGSAEKRLAFRVDSVTSAQELVVKSLPKPLLRVRHLAGASILGTGEIVLVLNAADLLKASSSSALAHVVPVPAAEEAHTLTILVADDSITTRALEKNILETAGYNVRAVANGVEAWNVLQSEGRVPDGLFSLVVTDVMMPGLTGFELTAKLRADARLKDLPVVLVTSLDSREDRERGVDVGADAYIVKGAFDQDNLLETIRRLI